MFKNVNPQFLECLLFQITSRASNKLHAWLKFVLNCNLKAGWRTRACGGSVQYHGAQFGAAEDSTGASATLPARPPEAAASVSLQLGLGQVSDWAATANMTD